VRNPSGGSQSPSTLPLPALRGERENNPVTS
jgi:hypothetical protein